MSVLDPAEAVAASLCWLSRQSGLPPLASLRTAVVQRHSMACAWCDRDSDELIRMIEETMRDEVATRRFERLTRSEQRRLVDIAQGNELLPA